MHNKRDFKLQQVNLLRFFFHFFFQGKKSGFQLTNLRIGVRTF